MGMEKRRYETYIFDLYGTLVDIHTEEETETVWEKLALSCLFVLAHAGLFAVHLRKSFLQQSLSPLC